MKASLLVWSLFSLAVAPSLATNLDKRQKETDEVGDGPTTTVFNGIDVPPQMELNPENFKTTIADGYWYVSSPCVKIFRFTLASLKCLTMDQ